jgi:hypothetical protein
MKKNSKPLITICASVAMYKKVNEVQEALEPLGFTVIVPKLAREMKKNNDYVVEHYKTWFANPDDYDKKSDYMRTHFEEVDKADAILVVNEEKKGVKNYIGGNVLMEMALAFFARKPIFILNDAPEGSAIEEEIRGVLPVFLHGKIEDLPKAWEKAKQS